MNFEGKTVIGYGVGFYYKAVKDAAEKIFHIDYLCDAKWDDSCIDSYDGIPVIKRKDLDKIPNKVLVIFSCNNPLVQMLTEEFNKKGWECITARELMGSIVVTGAQIKAEGKDGIFESGSNKVIYDESLPDNIWINFIGFNAKVKIGKNLIIDQFTVNMGSDCELDVGDNVRIVVTNVDVAGAKLIIGDDCLFSYNTEIRTHDSHMIFDKTTKERINYPKDVVIGPQVWLAAGAKILAGAKIGAGSVVAANAVTSSEFGENLIIAGAPAKVIRENIIWSKDNTAFGSGWDSFDECVSKDAKKL